MKTRHERQEAIIIKKPYRIYERKIIKEYRKVCSRHFSWNMQKYLTSG